jgi:hypothetical protein
MSAFGGKADMTAGQRRKKWSPSPPWAPASGTGNPNDCGSAQIKSPCQYLKRSRHHFLRFFAELTVKLRVIVRVHPTLKCLRGGRPIKEPRRYA